MQATQLLCQILQFWIILINVTHNWKWLIKKQVSQENLSLCGFHSDLRSMFILISLLNQSIKSICWACWILFMLWIIICEYIYIMVCKRQCSCLALIHSLIFIEFSKLAEIWKVIPDAFKLFTWDKAITICVKILEHRL